MKLLLKFVSAVIIILILDSCAVKTIDIVENMDTMMGEIKHCLKNNPKRKSGKICNAFIPLNKDLNDVATCISQMKNRREEYTYDEKGRIYDLDLFMSCEDEIIIGITIRRDKTTGKFYIYGISQIL